MLFVSGLISCVILLGVAFLKAVPESTYDAIIVDSSDPIGMLSLPDFHILQTPMEFPILCLFCVVNCNQGLHKSFLRNPSLNLWPGLFAPEELCAPKLKAYGFICTLLKTLLQIAVRYSKVLSTMHGQPSQHIRGTQIRFIF